MKTILIAMTIVCFSRPITKAETPAVVPATTPAATQPAIMDVLAEATSYGLLLNETLLTKMPVAPEVGQSISREINALADRQSDLRTKNLGAFLAIANTQAQLKRAGLEADPVRFQLEMERH